MCASTRSGPARRSTACRPPRGCPSAGRSTRIAAARMPASTASPARRTTISTSTPGATSSARSWSRSTCPRCCAPSSRVPSWTHEHVAMGTNTDPYQWVESRYRLMPGIWEALRDSATPCSVLTKSPLLLRDLPLMREIARRTTISANLSIPTLDEKAWRATEPHTPHPRARLEAVAELNRAGIPTGILIAPLMPGINDAPEQIEPLLERAAEAGRDRDRRHRAAPAGRGQGDLHGLAALAAPGPRRPLRGALPARRLRTGRRAPAPLGARARPILGGSPDAHARGRPGSTQAHAGPSGPQPSPSSPAPATVAEPVQRSLF